MNEVIYCISYDLRQPGRNYDELISAIKGFGTWWHQTESVWFIKSEKYSSDIRDYLKQYIDNNDKIFVIKVDNNWAGVGFSKEEYDWLRKNF